MKNTRFLVQAAAIAAIYVVLTLLFSPISFGESLIEFRVSEMLTVLPFYTPAAIPGLFIGVLLSNLVSPVGPIDVVLPVLVNGVIIGGMLHYVYHFPLWISVLSVMFGQVVTCYGLGTVLMLVLDKYSKYLFPSGRS